MENVQQKSFMLAMKEKDKSLKQLIYWSRFEKNNLVQLIQKQANLTIRHSICLKDQIS